MDRRTFIKSGAALAGSLILPFPYRPAADRIKLAIIGTGWWGTDILLKNSMASGQYEIAGLCDVDSVALNKAADIVAASGAPRPKLFADYRDLYAMPGLQAVAIATPTHWHALQFIDACKAGLHVFLEKPISYDIREGQAMLEAHRKANNIVQVDFPRMRLKNTDEAKALIQSGEVGKIMQVQANIHSREGQLVEGQIPKTLDYETYCGPAPKAKFLTYPNGTKPGWRSQREFSRGILFDWGIHYIHQIRYILGLDLPDNVMAMGGNVRSGLQHPDHLDVRFDFAGLPVNWTHKGWGYTSPLPHQNIGVYYFGEKGTVFVGDLGWEIYPANGGEKKVKGSVVFDQFTPANEPIYDQCFIDLFTQLAEGIRNKTEKGLTNPLEQAFKTTSAVNYADLSYQVKANLSIDPATMNIRNHAEAQKLLKRAYRAPYKHPYAS